MKNGNWWDSGLQLLGIWTLLTSVSTLTTPRTRYLKLSGATQQFQAKVRIKAQLSAARPLSQLSRRENSAPRNDRTLVQTASEKTLEKEVLVTG